MSRRWKKIKEDPARLSAYNDRVRWMRDDDLLGQHEETVTGRSALKIIQKQPKKTPKAPKLEESDDSDYDEPRVKRIQTLPKEAPKTPDEEPAVKQPSELIEAEPAEGQGDSYLEINLRDTAFDSIGVGKEVTYRGKKYHILEHVIMATSLK